MKTHTTAAVIAAAKASPRAAADGIAESAPAGRAAGGSLTLYSSSEARKHWSKITKKVLDGEKIAIIIGNRAVALQEVSLTYAETEYGVKESQIDAKAAEIESRAIEEINRGKARKIV